MRTQAAGINHAQDEVIEEFSHLTDWSEKYEYIIDLGKELAPLDAKYKNELHLVKGCQSNVWVHAEVNDGKIFLQADSDAIITKGIIALLIRVLSGQRVEDVANADLYFMDAIGLKSHLSPTRSNGLKNMIQHIRSYARHFMPVADKVESTLSEEEKRSLLIEKIKDVYDPEIPVDIWELGLIYKLDVDAEGKVTVVMTLTSPACPVAGSLPLEVQEKLLSLDFVKDVELRLVWDPAWSKERMSDEARMVLDMY